MASLIIYVDDPTFLEATLVDIANKTPPEDIDEIILCDDRLCVQNPGDAIVQHTDHVGRVAAWGRAASIAKSHELVFLRQATKVQDNWLKPLLAQLRKEPKSLVSPVIHHLNTKVWNMEAARHRRFGWRWDLQLYDRQSTNSHSAAVSAYGFAINRWFLDELGGFDVEMPEQGHADAIELALRCWLMGGRVSVVDDSVIATTSELTTEWMGLARIAELWFGRHATKFYDQTGLDRSQYVGRTLERQATLSIDDFLTAQLPELVDIYNLRQAATGKSVAIVGSSASVDLVDANNIMRHDIVIGLDYMGLVHRCDYVMTDNVDAAVQLRAMYSPEQFLLPLMLENRIAGTFATAAEVIRGCKLFERGGFHSDSVFPPFYGSEEIVHAAVHLALFMQPRLVTIYGCDGLVDGRSHSAKIEYYDDGFLWPDSDGTKKRLMTREQGLRVLGRLAARLRIPLLRVAHV